MREHLLTDVDLAGASESTLEASESDGARWTHRVRRTPETLGLLLFLLGEVVYFAVKSPYFLTWNNWVNILTAIALAGVIAAPATVLLVAGQFDLSVGSTAAFCGVTFAYFAPGVGVEAAVALAVAAGAVVGVLNGVLVTFGGINPLITTLGTLAIFRGLAFVIADGQTLLVEDFGWLGTTRPIGDVPTPALVFLGIAAAFALVLRATVYGRTMYAIGANDVAARLAGLRVQRSIFAGFVLTGVCAAVSALLLTSQLGSAAPTAATGLEFSVITAIVLGGASLSGGKGTMFGTALGLIIIGVLNNGLVLINVGSFWQDVARGVLLIVAVAFDQVRQRYVTRSATW